MTNKEFFVKTLTDERQKFRVAIEALPDDKIGHKVHDKAREAGSLTAQLAWQWSGISGIIKAGAPTMDAHMTTPSPKAEVLAKFDANYDQMMADLAAVTDQEWENGDASMGPTWSDKKYSMCWGFLFDAIHHRGQLTTYLRGMGEKVPSIYGPSADTQGQ